MSNLSIRWRITLWNTAAFALVLAGFGCLVYVLLRQTHYDQLDRRRLGRLQELQQDARRSEGEQRRHRFWGERFAREEFLGAIVDDEGRAVAGGGAGASSAADPDAPHFDTVSPPAVGRARRLTASLSAGGERYTVTLLEELEHVDEEMGLVAWSLLITIPATLAIAVAVSYLLARKALAPVEQLRRLTDEITAERLDRRLPAANPRDELGLLAQTVNAMIERLARSFAEVRRFTADASPELRTPLAVIRSEAEMGLETAQTLEESQARFASIVEECSRLAAMTDQLLDLCREDAGAPQAERRAIALAPLLSEVIETCQPLAQAKGQTLGAAWKCEAMFFGDPQRLRRVVFNLLDNAVKYTPEGGDIRVTLDRRESDAVIEVRDTGRGIPPEHQPRVFDRFYRADAGRSQQEGGAGLGLSIVKSIVTAHGGSVEVESELGRGAVFRVFLPNAEPRDAGE